MANLADRAAAGCRRAAVTRRRGAVPGLCGRDRRHRRGTAASGQDRHRPVDLRVGPARAARAASRRRAAPAAQPGAGIRSRPRHDPANADRLCARAARQLLRGLGTRRRQPGRGGAKVAGRVPHQCLAFRRHGSAHGHLLRWRARHARPVERVEHRLRGGPANPLSRPGPRQHHLRRAGADPERWGRRRRSAANGAPGRRRADLLAHRLRDQRKELCPDGRSALVATRHRVQRGHVATSRDAGLRPERGADPGRGTDPRPGRGTGDRARRPLHGAEIGPMDRPVGRARRISTAYPGSRCPS